MTPTSKCIIVTTLCCVHDGIRGRENDWSVIGLNQATLWKLGKCVRIWEAVQCSGKNMKVMVRRPGFYSCFLADWLCDFGLVPHFISVSLALMTYDQWPSWSVSYNIVHCLKSGKCVINIFWVTRLVLILYIRELMVLEFEWELRLKSRKDQHCDCFLWSRYTR